MSGRGKLCWASAHVLVPAQPDDERGWLRRVEYLAGAVAGVEMHDGDNFWDDCRWTLTERGRRTSMAELRRIILCDPPLEIALRDAKVEAAHLAGDYGGCDPGDPFLPTRQRILAHLESEPSASLRQRSAGRAISFPGKMGQLAERQVAEAITGLATCDKTSANQLVATDSAIDSIQRMIDKGVVEMIARRQPVADDLRQVLSILRIAHELERIGDLAKNIGKRILALGEEDLTPSEAGGNRKPPPSPPRCSRVG